MRGDGGSSRAPAVLPLRVTTVGESLDCAVVLLRQRAVPLLVVSAVLAAGEQWLLGVLRAGAGLLPPYYEPHARLHQWGDWWQILATGFALEVGIVAVLGAYAGAAAGPALLGRPAGGWSLWRRARLGRTLPVALLLAVAAWPLAWGGVVGLLALCALFGLATPILAMERTGNPLRALGRSAALSVRGGLRVARVRFLGYLTWLAIRFALGAAWLAVADTVLGLAGAGSGWVRWATPVAWGLANTVAYAALACLDAVLLVESRIRTEGLDIGVRRSRARGEDETAMLGAGR
ncbi:hypothetical protein [Paractinoplanes ferrugineus]|nr:hypothetical protein [Actinoplanes ferrugineus]